MKAPKLPSLFKIHESKSFEFKPRYLKAKKRRKKMLFKENTSQLKITKNKNLNKEQKVRKYRILFLIIILSLLAYKLILN